MMTYNGDEIIMRHQNIQFPKTIFTNEYSIVKAVSQSDWYTDQLKRQQKSTVLFPFGISTFHWCLIFVLCRPYPHIQLMVLDTANKLLNQLGCTKNEWTYTEHASIQVGWSSSRVFAFFHSKSMVIRRSQMPALYILVSVSTEYFLKLWCTI